MCLQGEVVVHIMEGKHIVAMEDGYAMMVRLVLLVHVAVEVHQVILHHRPSSSNNSYNNVTTRKTTTTRKITTTTKKQVYGCMDSSAINYNVGATNKDGSCQYEKTKIKTEDINYNTKIKAI